MQDEVIIVDAQGVEHEFPAGMDPKKAAAIVKAKSAPKWQAGSSLPPKGFGTDSDPINDDEELFQPMGFSKPAFFDLMEGAAEPKTAGDMAGLMMPAEGVAGAAGRYYKEAKRVGGNILRDMPNAPSIASLPFRILRGLGDFNHLPDLPKTGLWDKGGQATLASQNMNRMPLAQQMEHLPETPAPILKRGGGNPPPTQGTINDIPLAKQADMLPSSGGTPSARQATPRMVEQESLVDVPLYKQMEMMGEELRKPPSPQAPQSVDINTLPAEAATSTDEATAALEGAATRGELPVAPAEKVERPRILSWKEGQGPSDDLIGTLRDEEGSKAAASRLKIPVTEVKDRAPRMNPRSLPTAAQERIEQAMAGMTQEEKLVYLEAAPNDLAELFIRSKM